MKVILCIVLFAVVAVNADEPELPLSEPIPLPSLQPKPAVLPAYKPAVLPTYKSAVLPAYKPAVLPAYKPAISPTYKPAILPTYKSAALPAYKPAPQLLKPKPSLGAYKPLITARPALPQLKVLPTAPRRNIIIKPSTPKAPLSGAYALG